MGWVSAGCAVLLAGCSELPGERDAVDQGNAATAAAYSALHEGQWDEAIRAFNEVLDFHPELFRLHLDLANLYLDHGKEPVLAIYHYSRYLDLRPDTQKRVLIEDRIRVARVQVSNLVGKELLARVAASEAVISSNLMLRASVAELGRKLKVSESALKQTESTLKESLGLISRLQQSEKRLSQVLRGQKGAGGNDAMRPPENVAADRPRTYRVKRGDSLSRIARNVYGDGALWPRLLEANKDLLRGDPEHLDKGQILVVP